MIFNSWPFAAFFLLFLAGYTLVRTHVGRRNAYLLAASYLFYAAWDVRFLALIAFTTCLDYLAAIGAAGERVDGPAQRRAAGFLAGIGLLCWAGNRFAQPWLVLLVAGAALGLLAMSAVLERLEGPARRRAWLIASVVLNLGVLGFFKYWNFFAASLHDSLAAVGIEAGRWTLAIILPLGISFHTFQSMARTIDAHRGALRPSRSLLEYATFLSYFPQLVAGPIERANHFLPQFRRVQPLDGAMLRSGAHLFLWGLYKKLAVADTVAPIANAAFASPGTMDSGALAAGVVAFTIQIYGDFSGYSDMARGLARMMGFDLFVNFDLPYFARTPSEFWTRWHISLSRWLRDYLYVALGGNRVGRWLTYRNLLLTMLLGGLWHGAAWTFLIWGGLHGAILIAYRVLGVDAALRALPPRTALGVLAHVASWGALMLLVMLAWVFFRATDLGNALAVLRGILAADGGSFDPWRTILFYATPLAVVEAVLRFMPARQAGWHVPFLLRYTGVLSLLLAILVLGAHGGQKFIYFDF